MIECVFFLKLGCLDVTDFSVERVPCKADSGLLKTTVTKLERELIQIKRFPL